MSGAFLELRNEFEDDFFCSARCEHCDVCSDCLNRKKKTCRQREKECDFHRSPYRPQTVSDCRAVPRSVSMSALGQKRTCQPYSITRGFVQGQIRTKRP